ncbi:hypothetical protein MTBBW1_1940025 [Desulfamplus magnetovallimortis]|uniref:Uncharacterized protein n=1 Tax=Desulfamplus magnetovallimortis TaxID=1246637 RepID=A0A1W1HBE5_9BACT|nr:hypothetical protein MTBBW1_1940025 [Desulfamplus magnetovallimortis]
MKMMRGIFYGKSLHKLPPLKLKNNNYLESFISCSKYFTLFGTGHQKNRNCVQANVNWQMKDANYSS